MKAIKDMNLGEIASFLEAGKPSAYLLEQRLRELHDLTRWIPVSEGYPNEGETVLCRRVEGGMGGSKEIKPQVGTFRNGNFDCVFDWTRVTHWQRITPPEGV